MSGRTDMSLLDRDIICLSLNISPVDVVMRRTDLEEGSQTLDLRYLPEGGRKALRILYAEMLIICSKR